MDGLIKSLTFSDQIRFLASTSEKDVENIDFLSKYSKITGEEFTVEAM
jgi:hypothetical protein